jgi:hypothetical protein
VLVTDAIQGFLAKMNDREAAELRLPPAVEEAMAKLTELFSDQRISETARFR